MREVLFDSMTDRQCLIGTLLPTTAGTIHRLSRACDKHDVQACRLLKLDFEYLAAMQFSVCTQLQTQADS
jgi:hypothetical protein